MGLRLEIDSVHGIADVYPRRGSEGQRLWPIPCRNCGAIAVHEIAYGIHYCTVCAFPACMLDNGVIR